MLKKRIQLLIVLTLLVFFSCSKTPPVYYRIDSRWTRTLELIIPCDMDGDGQDELVTASKVQIDVIAQNDKTNYKSFRITKFPDWKAVPLPGSNIDSTALVLNYRTEDTLFYDLFSHVDSNKETRHESAMYRFPRLTGYADVSGYDQGLKYINYFNSRLGHLALFSLNTAYNKNYDRGVLAYDFDTMRERWRYVLGPNIVNVQTVDIDNDEFDEIVIGTYAPVNGLAKNGTSDDSAYIFVLDDDGSLKWRKRIGGEFTSAYCMLSNFGNTGNRICVIKTINSGKEPQDQIMLLDPLTGELVIEAHRFGTRIPLVQILPYYPSQDINNDGRDEIVFGNTDGFVRAIDGELRLLHMSKPYRKEITVEAIVDLNGDGRKEIICHLQQEKLVILDSELREMTTFPLDMEFGHSIQVVKTHHYDRLLLHSAAPGFSIYQLLELQESFVPFETYTGAAKYFWWSLAGLAIVGFLYINVKRRGRILNQLYIRFLKLSRSFDTSLLIDTKGKILAAGVEWEALSVDPAHSLIEARISDDVFPSSLQIQIVRNLNKVNKIIPKLSIEKDHQSVPIGLDIEYIDVLSEYRITLRYLKDENFLKNIKHWSGVAQKLAHGIKNPLTAIKLNADELEYHINETKLQNEEMLEHIHSISSQVEKLRRMADGFMRFVEFEEPNLTQTDINQFIEQLVSQEQDNFPTTVRVTLELGKILPFALIDQQQFKFAFENVFYNAIQSLDDHGTVHVSTHFVQQLDPDIGIPTDYIEVRIQDTGRGIPPDVLQKVTMPYYTTKKEGTGLGLSIVLKIIEMHDGQFDIQSQVNVGTTVTFRLRPTS